MRPAAIAAAKKAQWLAATEALIVAKYPHVSGRIKWVELVHLFNIGCTPEDAFARYSFHVIVEMNKAGSAA